ncbi:Uncharacterised protein [Mycobacterium tuberculosis]|nr:Uncharacterised protein [Mycobacterium tuberculosis]
MTVSFLLALSFSKSGASSSSQPWFSIVVSMRHSRGTTMPSLRRNSRGRPR